MIYNFEHKTKQGMLKYIVTEIEDEEITLLISYKWYKADIEYETFYTSKDIKAMHKLFALDPIIILDVIKDNMLIKEIHVNSNRVNVIYNIILMKHEYIITVRSDRITQDDVDKSIIELQKQNKTLSEQISKLTIHLDDMDKRFNNLAIIVANLEFISSGTYRRQLNLGPLCDLIDIHKVNIIKSQSYVQMLCSRIHSYDLDKNPEFKIMLDNNIDLNVCNVDGHLILSSLINSLDIKNHKRIIDYIKVMIEKGVNITQKDKFGKTPLQYCEDRIHKCKEQSNPDLDRTLNRQPNQSIDKWTEIQDILLNTNKKYM